MDISRPVTYRGLTLTGAAGGPGGNNPIDGIRLTRARYSDVSVHAYVEKRSLDDGFDASDIFIGMRTIELTGEVFAASKAGLFDLLDVVRLKFTPTDAYNEDPSKQGFLPLGFSQPTLQTVYWPSGFCDRVLYARPSMQPAHTIELGAIGGRSEDGYVVPFQTGLVAKDPRFYAPTVVEEDLSGTSGSGTLQNRGNYPTPLNLVIVPPLSTAMEFTFVGMGTNMELSIPSSASPQALRVDSDLKVVTLTTGSVEALRMDLIQFLAGTTWPKVPPTPEGDSPAGFTWNADQTVQAGSRLFFNEAWV